MNFEIETIIYPEDQPINALVLPHSQNKHRLKQQ